MTAGPDPKRWSAVHVVDVLDVRAIEKIEYLEAEFAPEPLLEWDLTLDADVRVVQRVAAVGISADRSDTIREWKLIAIDIEAGEDRVKPGALQSVEHREFELAEQHVPRGRCLSESH